MKKTNNIIKGGVLWDKRGKLGCDNMRSPFQGLQDRPIGINFGSNVESQVAGFFVFSNLGYWVLLS